MRADEERAVREVRQGVEKVRDEVKSAEPYPGGRRWEPRLRTLAARLEAATDGGAKRVRWFRRAIDGFGERSRDGALQVLTGLHRRLSLLEESLSLPRNAPEAGGKRPGFSKEEIKRRLRPRGEDLDAEARRKEERAKEAREEQQRREVQRDDPEPARRGRAASGVLAPHAGGLGAAGWYLLAGLALAVLAVAGYLAWSARSKSNPAAQRPQSGSSKAAAEELLAQPHEQPVAVLWRRAEDLAREGRFLEAVRGLYLAVLALLHRKHLLRFEPTRTNGEYVRQVRLAAQAPPGLHVPFEELTTRFEVKWYGERSCAADEYAAYRGLAEEIQEQVGRA